MKINIRDIIDLAKSGFTPADVKELIALSGTEGPEDAPEEPKEAPIESQERDGAEDGAKESTPESGNDHDEIKKLTDENKQLRAQIAKMQDANRRQDHSGDDKPEEFQKTFEDIARGYM